MKYDVKNSKNEKLIKDTLEFDKNDYFEYIYEESPLLPCMWLSIAYIL